MQERTHLSRFLRINYACTYATSYIEIRITFHKMAVTKSVAHLYKNPTILKEKQLFYRPLFFFAGKIISR